MTNPVTPTPPLPVTPAANNNKIRHWATFAAIGGFILCGVLYLLYWFMYAQYYESTDDAYVNGNMLTITPLEEGIVTQILADNTQMIKLGQPLVELDRHDHEILLEKAQADLAQTVRMVAQMFITVEELDAKRDVYKANLIRAIRDYEHRALLVDDGSISREDFEHSQTTLYAAYAALRETENEHKISLAAVQNTLIPNHPLVEQSKARLRTEFLALHRCTVLSPVEGIVTQRNVQIGEKVKASDNLMSVIPLQEIWVDANLREVNLKNLRIGQPVVLFSDMYGRSQKFKGRVIGFNPGTGSVFSVLPPQNATGNWIKIVQRVPVKIGLDPEEIKKYPLFLGLSITVKVDTHDRKGVRLPEAITTKPIYSTPVYDDELDGADEMIDQIIFINTPTAL